MIAIIYDSETTGLDFEKDRIVQHGALAYDIKHRKVIEVFTMLCWEKDFPAVAAGEKVHGWNLETLLQYGRHPGVGVTEVTAMAYKHNARLIVAHNGTKYDKNMFAAEIHRCASKKYDISGEKMMATPWLDTMHHAVYPGCPNKALITVNAHHGFINMFPHDAVGDCLSLVRILQNPARNLVREMAEHAATVYSLVFADVPKGFDPKMNDRLKAKKFTWQESGEHFYEKTWLKIIPQQEFPSFSASCDFPIKLIKELQPEECYVNLVKELTEAGL